MIFNKLLFFATAGLCSLRGPRPNATELTDLKVFEVDIFSIFDDLAANLKENHLNTHNQSDEPVIKNIIYLTSEDVNKNSNLNIRSSTNQKSEDCECHSLLLLIVNFITLALSFINIMLLLSNSRSYIRYRIPAESLLHEERSMTPCSSQTRSI